jgi:chromosomal replication initiation ATPase DnaA
MRLWKKLKLETWFKSTKPISFEENTFVLAVPHAFAADWLSSRYGHLIEEILRNITGNPEMKLKMVYPSEGIVNEKSVHTDSSKVDMLVRLENRLDRIEEKLDKLMELLSKNKVAD